MMKELKLEGRYNENGFSTKRKRNRKNGAYLVLYLMGILKLELHASFTKNQKDLEEGLLLLNVCSNSCFCY
jgi:hypothetical protein